jgi:hypothetical protein
MTAMTGRPQPDEVGSYYFTYIDQVPGDDPLAVIESQLDRYVPPLLSISEEKSRYRYRPGKWSVREVLNHLSDTERAFVFRALWFARGFDSPLPGYDQIIAANGALADSISWAAHVEEFKRVRLATIAFFQNLPNDAWMRRGIASDNPFTVRALAFIVAGHVTHHFKILEDRYF